MNPVNGRRENRNRIPRAMVGFSNAVLVTGDQKYADAWRTMMDAVNCTRAHGRRPETVSHDARRRRLVWLAERAVECRRAGALVSVDARGGSGAGRG